MDRTIEIKLSITDQMWAELVAAAVAAGLTVAGEGRESLGDKVRAARIKRCLSRDGLARRAGVSTNTIIRMEEGECTPIEKTLQRIAQALGQDAGVLIEARGKSRVGVAGTERQADA